MGRFGHSLSQIEVEAKSGSRAGVKRLREASEDRSQRLKPL